MSDVVSIAIITGASTITAALIGAGAAYLIARIQIKEHFKHERTQRQIEIKDRRLNILRETLSKIVRTTFDIEKHIGWVRARCKTHPTKVPGDYWQVYQQMSERLQQVSELSDNATWEVRVGTVGTSEQDIRDLLNSEADSLMTFRENIFDLRELMFNWPDGLMDEKAFDQKCDSALISLIKIRDIVGEVSMKIEEVLTSGNAS